MIAHGHGTVTPASVLVRCARDEEVEVTWARWPAVVAAARKTNMVLRLAAWFDRRLLTAPPSLAVPLREAFAQQLEVERLVDHVAAHCAALGTPCVFTKLAQSMPDVGRDLDVLTTRPDAPMPAVESAIPLDVSRDGIGLAQAHRAVAERIVGRRRRFRFGATCCDVPSPEDQVLLLALSRFYAQPTLRLADVASVSAMHARGELDLVRLRALARESGVALGIECFLACVDGALRALGIAAPPLGSGQAPRWLAVRVRGERIAIPSIRLAALLLSDQLRVAVRARDWPGFARLARLPFLFLLRRVQRTRPHREGRLLHA